MTQPINPLVQNLEPDRILTFQKSLSQFSDLVYLTFGEPGFATPEPVKAATKAAIDADRSHYGNSQGEPALREAALAYLADRYQLSYPSIDNLIMTAGVTEGIQAIFKTLLQEGDGLLIPDPAYGSYFAALSLAGGVVLPINTAKANFKLTPELVDEAMASAKVPVRAVLFNYPNNPTGVSYDLEELKALAACFERHDLWVISDEIYAELTYQGQHHSLGKLLPERTIVVNGLSKSHAMTGYRLGLIAGPSEIIQEIQKVHGSSVFSLPTFVQDGAVAAFQMSRDDLDYMRESYQERRDYVADELRALGFELVAPKGAFYLFAKLPDSIQMDSADFAMDLAKNGGVALIPGTAFSMFDEAKRYVRLSYAADMATLKAGLARLKAYLNDK
ncbi:aminotransferase class I/II-fold pyridoxal phosphate-dependent enzyme [Fructobacillus papyrifericola]|uniref:Aminotransferase n=1 Tax=Fructobacillus papyrifericola TaxID=2713172 RepID=A0ABS5QTF1_9LACO|nr:aminotransferase class I/II-fold pyridoxal phosphate-dependent enzyme [Fructobacillus papyrifericola]MBS9336107.1 aminotransferase class I/II-fold pyridoxal phosphate-dependent enzyme [Fructobacillus papyrifericola]